MYRRTQLTKHSGQVISMVLFCFMVSCGFAAAASDNVVAAIVEPRTEVSGLSYSASIRGERLESTKTVLDGLGDDMAARLMLLVREDTPLGSVTEIVSMGLKAGYERDSIYLFSFDTERKGVVAIPGYRYAQFSESPIALSELVVRCKDPN